MLPFYSNVQIRLRLKRSVGFSLRLFVQLRRLKPTLRREVALIGATVVSIASIQADTMTVDVSFSRDVAPIFQRHCVGCHREGKSKGKYRIDSYADAMKAVVAGNVADSEVFYRITTDDGDDRMPVDADPLPKAGITLIREWIEQGAEYDADDPDALLSAIVPLEPHPPAPDVYPRPIPVTAMVWAKDGEELVTGGYHELLVWDVNRGQLLRRIPDNGQRTYDLSLSPNGRWLAAATGAPGQLGELRIFDAETGEVLATPVRLDDVALCAAFSPDGSRLAFGGSDGKLRVFDTESWKEQFVLTAHSDWINALSWNQDGSRLATGSRDKTAKVFDASGDGKRLITFSGHTEAVRGVAFHPNGGDVLSCGDDGLFLKWNIENGKKTADVAEFEDSVYRLVTSDAGYFLIESNSCVQFALAEGHKRIREFNLQRPIGGLTECAVHDSRFAVGTFDGRVVTLDVTEQEEVGSFFAAPLPK
jgi:hypothetical protein